MARFAAFSGFNQAKPLSSFFQPLPGEQTDDADFGQLLQLSSLSGPDPEESTSSESASQASLDTILEPLTVVQAKVGAGTYSGPGTTSSAEGATAETAIFATATAETATFAKLSGTDVSVATLTSSSLVVERRVASGADDAEQRGPGSVALASSDLELVVDGNKVQTVGIRFTDLGIPHGATITKAYIQFQAHNASTGSVSLMIRGQDSDNAAAFSSVKNNVSSRPSTEAQVPWTSIPTWTMSAAGVDQRTPDLSAIVQEIVDRGGWSASNGMAFIITGSGTRRAEAFEGNAAAAPLLHVEYTLPAGGSPVAFDIPPDTDTNTDRIGELAIAGTPVGITASATDPDTTGPLIYRVDDNRFAISASGVITRSTTGTLDFETQPSITLKVTATSNDGSSATHDFALAVTDQQEPVVFNSKADSDDTANGIAANAAAGTPVGITASASDPDSGDIVIYSIPGETRFAIGANGVITRSGTGVLTPGSITLNVRATSSDGSHDDHSFSLTVTSSTQPPLPSSVSLVRTVQTSPWPSPDPSGIAYITHLGRLLIADGEVDEMSIFTGKNLFEMSLNGTLLKSWSTISFSDEPTGVAYNPSNHHLFFTDDTGTRGIYELDPGNDGNYGTIDDKVTFANTGKLGLTDAEGLTYDTTRGVLHIVGGANGIVLTLDPGPNGKFEGANTGSDDVATSFASGPLGITDAEGIEYDPAYDLLYIIANKNTIAMVSVDDHQLLGTLDISAASARKPAGLALAPSSDGNPDHRSLYVVDRAVDNNTNPNENDGKVYEFLLHDFPIA